MGSIRLIKIGGNPGLGFSTVGIRRERIEI
jgi:hypothetical protein